MAKKFGDKLDDLNLTNDEVKRLSECMKDKKFMDMLKDYALEISDPKNKKKYEEEIAMMEGERGNDVKFINPTAGYVLKTVCNGKEKCFVNICSSTTVGKPSCKPSTQNSTKGMNWSIPHSLSQPRDDTDKSSKKCIVYDVVFHPDTCHMTEKNSRFRQMVENIALNAVERNFSVNLDKVNVKRPKMKYKGMPQTSMIRVPRKDTKSSTTSQDQNDPLAFPYPPMNNNHDQCEDSAKSNPNLISVISDAGTTVDEKKEFVQPQYNLVHRGYFDIKNYYAMSDQTVASTRPRELVLTIELPMLKSAEPLELEISESCVYLECTKPVKYKLDIKLPFPVDDTKGSAKFDKSKKRLIVTLEVLPPVLQKYVIDQEGPAISEDNEPTKSKDAEQSQSVSEERAPSSHPSGLVHVDSKCRHENHGLLWDKAYEENSNNIDSPPLSVFSPSLVKVLLDEDQNRTVLKKIRPHLTFHQSDEFVVFIIHIKNIDSEKLWYTVSCNDLKLSCMAEKDGITDEIHQLYISFNVDDHIEPQRSRVDISDDNAVFALRKQPKCLYEWQNFKVGFDDEELVQRCFLTEKNLVNLSSKVQEEVNSDKYESLEYQIIAESECPKMLALKLSVKERERLKLSIDEGNAANDLIDMLKILDDLDDKQDEIVEDKPLTSVSHECLKQNYQQGNETDEDDSSASDSAESDDEKIVESAATESKSPYDASLIENINGNLQQKGHKQAKSTGTSTVLDKSDGTRKADLVNEKCDMINKALIVHEHEKGNEVKSQVYTDHKTKSVVTLNNEMLFEIDSD